MIQCCFWSTVLGLFACIAGVVSGKSLAGVPYYDERK